MKIRETMNMLKDRITFNMSKKKKKKSKKIKK
jgi:hypothetical protein